MFAYSRIWAPRAGWFGTQLMSTGIELGTGGITIADTATTSVLIPVPGIITTYSKAEAVLVALNFQVSIAALSAAGTVLMQAFKRNNQGTPADVTLTGTQSIEADVVTTLQWTYAFPITATADSSLIFKTTDALRLDIVTTNSVGTQPTMNVTAMWAIRRV